MKRLDLEEKVVREKDDYRIVRCSWRPRANLKYRRVCWEVQYYNGREWCLHNGCRWDNFYNALAHYKYKGRI